MLDVEQTETSETGIEIDQFLSSIIQDIADPNASIGLIKVPWRCMHVALLVEMMCCGCLAGTRGYLWSAVNNSR